MTLWSCGTTSLTSLNAGSVNIFHVRLSRTCRLARCSREVDDWNSAWRDCPGIMVDRNRHYSLLRHARTDPTVTLPSVWDSCHQAGLSFVFFILIQRNILPKLCLCGLYFAKCGLTANLLFVYVALIRFRPNVVSR